MVSRKVKTFKNLPLIIKGSTFESLSAFSLGFKSLCSFLSRYFIYDLFFQCRLPYFARAFRCSSWCSFRISSIIFRSSLLFSSFCSVFLHSTTSRALGFTGKTVMILLKQTPVSAGLKACVFPIRSSTHKFQKIKL